MEDISLHLLDILENSIEARARRIEVRIVEDLQQDLLTLEIGDDGRGMDSGTLQRALDPFFTTRATRKVGLGLSMLAESARATGGSLAIDSVPGRGTRVQATFRPRHIDMKPAGDIAQTLLTVLAGHPQVALRYEHFIGQDSFVFDTRQADATTGAPRTLAWMVDRIRRGLDELAGRAKGAWLRSSGRE
jgi:hypothetical protein